MSETTPQTIKSLEDVLSNCTNPESTLNAVICDIDADAAMKLLEMFNSTNRKLQPSLSKLYANEMLRGKWKLNGEALIFGIDEAGNESIISGQHRLNAVVEANKQYAKSPNAYPEALLTLHTVCIYGVDLSSADTVDIGKLRSHGDVLFRDEWVSQHIPKEWNTNPTRRNKWAKCLSHAARLVWLREGGATVSSAPKFLVSAMLEFLKTKHESLCEFVSAVLSASEEEGGGLKISIPYIAALTYMASLNEDGEVDPIIKETVLDAVLNIAQLQVKPATPEHALLAYWNDLMAKPGSNDRDLDIVGPFVKALNAIIVGDKITVKQIRLTDKERENYTHNPPLLKGYDEHCFIQKAEFISKLKAEAEAIKEQKALEAEQRKAEAEARKAEAEKKKKEAEEAKANIAKAMQKKVTTEGSGPMQALKKMATNGPKPSTPIIKKKAAPKKSPK